MLLFIWFVTLFAALWLYLRQKYSKFSKRGVKNLKPFPFLGNMGKVTLRLEHLTECHEKNYKAFPDERFCGVYEFLNPVIVIKDLDLIKKVTVKDFEHFLDHRAMIDEEVEPFFGKNLFSLKGQKWKDMRCTLSPAFTSSKIRLMVPFMDEAAKQTIRSLQHRMQDAGVDYLDVDCRDLLTRYSNDVTASCAFGLKVNSHTEKSNEFYQMGQSASNFNFYQVLKFLGYSAFPNVMKILKVKMFSERSRIFFKHLVTSTMESRVKNKTNRNDIIQILMEAKNGKLSHSEVTNKDADAGFATVEESEVGKNTIATAWSDDDLIAQAVVFFIAGVEISSFMTFMFFELAANVDVQSKLVQEIKEHNGKDSGALDYTSIQRLIYLDMVVSEVLRKWSPAFMDRKCKKNYNLGKANSKAAEDYVVREGEGILIPVWAIHRCPEYYPDPLKFDPKRFSEENKHNIKPYTYLPFGVGPRNCIGSRFALCEMKVMAYWLLLNMEVSPCEKTRLPIKLSTESMNLRIKGGHWLRMKIRNDAS